MWLRDREPGPPGTGSIVIIALALLFFLLISAGYTQWALDHQFKQSCTELHVLATGRGADTPYDRTIRGEYMKLFELRCG